MAYYPFFFKKIQLRLQKSRLRFFYTARCLRWGFFPIWLWILDFDFRFSIFAPHFMSIALMSTSFHDDSSQNIATAPPSLSNLNVAVTTLSLHPKNGFLNSSRGTKGSIRKKQEDSIFVSCTMTTGEQAKMGSKSNGENVQKNRAGVCNILSLLANLFD